MHAFLGTPLDWSSTLESPRGFPSTVERADLARTPSPTSTSQGISGESALSEDGSASSPGRNSSSTAATPPSPERSMDGLVFKRTAFKKKCKPALPALVGGGQDLGVAVNPFESSRMRRNRSCEAFLQQEDGLEEGSGPAEEASNAKPLEACRSFPRKSILKRPGDECAKPRKTLCWAAEKPRTPCVMAELARTPAVAPTHMLFPQA
eukprot:Hpha_TRINITY_DN7701_c1_g1::TRINITY_DN7701_c1_g1_i1::g.85554::m.85554